MKINAFADVSLRAMMVLAAAPDGGLLTTQSIADAVATPYNHVSKAMAKLRELGMIDVERGRHGGSRLSSAGRLATVGQLLRQLDTRTDPADCVGAGGACPLINECRLRGSPRPGPRGFLPRTGRHRRRVPADLPADGAGVPGDRPAPRPLSRGPRVHLARPRRATHAYPPRPGIPSI